jgi:hypothetical protein
MREGSFEAAIAAHLELQRRNRGLEEAMPIAGYREEAGAAVAEAELSVPAAPAVAASDAPTAATDVRAAPWDEPDSWWNVRDPAFDWGD